MPVIGNRAAEKIILNDYQSNAKVDDLTQQKLQEKIPAKFTATSQIREFT
jgi:hypothetical protein